MVCNATFNNTRVFQLLVEEPEDPEKTSDLSQASDKLYHLAMSGIRTYNICDDRRWLYK